MQNAQEQGMKGSHPQISCPFGTDLFGNTLFHFPGCFVCKCQCQNVPWLITVLQQPCYFVCKYTGFS